MKTTNLFLILSATLLFALIIWPGQWKYDRLGELPMRTHRLTGRSELFTGTEWMPVGQKRDGAAADTSRMLSAAEKEEVRGNGGVDAMGYFNGTLYNGSECTVTRVVYRVSAKNARDSSFRTFSEDEYVPPRQTKDVIFQVDARDANRVYLGWAINSIQAKCAKHEAGP